MTENFKHAYVVSYDSFALEVFLHEPSSDELDAVAKRHDLYSPKLFDVVEVAATE
jgi:hypothetical protein